MLPMRVGLGPTWCAASHKHYYGWVRRTKEEPLVMFFEATHAVTHQAEPRINVNEFRANIALVEAVAAYVLDAARRRSH